MVDINNCTLEQLQNLPGVNASMGARLMAGRPFRSFDDLSRDGIPLNVVEGLRGVITFGRRNGRNTLVFFRLPHSFRLFASRFFPRAASLQ